MSKIFLSNLKIVETEHSKFSELPRPQAGASGFTIPARSNQILESPPACLPVVPTVLAAQQLINTVIAASGLMVRITLRTPPFSNLQGHRFHLCASQLAHKFSPGSIGDRVSQSPVLHHALDLQVFQGQVAVLTYQ